MCLQLLRQGLDDLLVVGGGSGGLALPVAALCGDAVALLWLELRNLHAGQRTTDLRSSLLLYRTKPCENTITVSEP